MVIRVFIVSISIATQRIIWCVFYALLLCTVDGVSQSDYDSINNVSFRDFMCAVTYPTTAPKYVLVVVANGRTGESYERAITATGLLGAIHREYGISYKKGGRDSSLRIALASRDRRFVFTVDSALAQVMPTYTQDVLDTVRKILLPLSPAEIQDGFSIRRDGRLHRIYDLRAERWAYRDAVAHVLLERGIPCGRDGSTGGIYIDNSPCVLDE